MDIIEIPEGCFGHSKHAYFPPHFHTISSKEKHLNTDKINFDWHLDHIWDLQNSSYNYAFTNHFIPQKTFLKLPSIDNNNIDKLQFQLSTLSFNDAIFDVTDYSLYISISGLVITIIIVFGIIGYVYYRNRASKIKREGKFVSIMPCTAEEIQKVAVGASETMVGEEGAQLPTFEDLLRGPVPV